MTDTNYYTYQQICIFLEVLNGSKISHPGLWVPSF